MDSPSRRRYENVFPSIIGHDITGTKYDIVIYCDGSSMCKIKKPARVMLYINHEYFITICITKHFVFPLFPWNWLFGIKKELDFITKYKDMFFKHWKQVEPYGYDIQSIMWEMLSNNLTEEEAVEVINKEKYEIRRNRNNDN